MLFKYPTSGFEHLSLKRISDKLVVDVSDRVATSHCLHQKVTELGLSIHFRRLVYEFIKLWSPIESFDHSSDP